MTEPTALPAPVRYASKARCAEFFGVTPSAVDGWIRRGCPVVTHGSQTSAYVLDLLAVARWRFDRDRPPPADPEAMMPTDRRAWYEGEARRRQLLDRAAELIPAADVERAIARAVALITAHLEGVPDRLAAIDLPPAVVQAVRADIAAHLGAMRDRLAHLGPTDA